MSNNTKALSGNTLKDSRLKETEILLSKLDIPLLIFLAKNNRNRFLFKASIKFGDIKKVCGQYVLDKQ